MRVTIDDVTKLGPCDGYPISQLIELADGRSYLTPSEIADLDIPVDDRLWVLTRLMTADQRDRYARRCASDVLHLWDAPQLVRRWLTTGDPTLRAAARAAAWAVWEGGLLWAAKAAAWASMEIKATGEMTATSAARAVANEGSKKYNNRLDVYVRWAFRGLEK